MDKQPLTTRQAADLLGLTIGRIRQLAQAGTIQAVKFGRDWQIDPQSAEQYGKRRADVERLKDSRETAE